MTFLRFFSILVFLFSWSYLIKIPLANKGSVNLLDLLIIFYLVCFLVWLWREKKIKNFIGWLAGNKLFWLFTVFVFFVFISWTANIKIDPWNNLGLIKSFFVLPGLFAATLPYLNRARANWFRDYLAGFLFYSSGLALASIFAFLAGQTSYDGRVSLIFQSPNQLVFLLSVGYLVSVVFLLLRKENKLLLALSTAVHLLAILSTHSAGAALSVAVLTIGAAAIKKYPQAAIVIPAVAVALQIILLLGILNTNLLLKHSSRNPFENKNSLDSRLVVHSVTENFEE